MEEEKVKAIKEWKTPTKVKDVESFLGFMSRTEFWRREI